MLKETIESVFERQQHDCY